MKKNRSLLLTGILLLAGISGAVAQRHTDLSLSPVSPADSAVIENGDSQAIQLQLVNNGPDTFLVSDTMYISGNLLNLPPNALLRGSPSEAIPPGADATIQFSGPFGVILNDRTAATDTVMELCLSLVTGNLLATPIATDVLDTLPENNTACVTVTFKGATTGIAGNRKEQRHLKLYPNPANDAVTFDIALTKEEQVTATIRDVAGRAVVLEHYGKAKAGQHMLPMDVSGLSPGIYYAEVKAGEQLWAGKLVIQ